MKPNTTPQEKTPKHHWTCPAICASVNNFFFVQSEQISLSLILSPRGAAKSSQIRRALKHPHSSELRSCFNNESLTRQRKKLFVGEQNTLGFGVWKLIDAFCIGNVIQMGSVCSSNAPTSSKIAPEAQLKHGLLLQVLFLKWI